MSSGPSGACRPPKVKTSVDIKDETIVKSVRAAGIDGRPFVMWDGEAVQDGAGYCLLGNSQGDEICSPNLGTIECFELMLESAIKIGRAFHFAYAFDYDVNNILKDLPWLCLIMLKERGRCVWQGYEIHHIPHKSFSVKHESTGRKIKIDDVFTFFRSPYSKALSKYRIGTAAQRDIIVDGKQLRPDFRYCDIDDKIRPYYKLELKLGVLLMDQLRRDIYGAGMYIKSWHGPAACSAYVFNTNKMQNHMAKTPIDVLEAAIRAYAGGWFERFKAGYYIGSLYTADINSAYAYAMAQLPSLTNGTWRHLYASEGDLRSLARTVRFGIFRVKYTGRLSDYTRTCQGIPFPNWIRDSNGSVTRSTFDNDCWYWNPEASLIASKRNAEFVEAWIFEDDGTYPFAWVEDMFNLRLAMQAENNPAEKGLKWALASGYGITAQRAGWDRRKKLPPRWHQIEWAGWITSLCRSMIYTSALSVAPSGSLVSIDTDGITSTSPFIFGKSAPPALRGKESLQNGQGNQLGRWKVEEYSGILYIQTGVYWLRDMQGEWIAPKVRGVPADQIPSIDDAKRALAGDGTITINRHNFIGYGSAIHGRRDEWRTWTDADYTIDVRGSGSTRQHSPLFCAACHDGKSLMEGLHDLSLRPPKGNVSQPHKLPWLEADDTDELNIRLRHEISEMFA